MKRTLLMLFCLTINSVFAQNIELKHCESNTDIVKFEGGYVKTGVVCGQCQYQPYAGYNSHNYSEVDKVKYLRWGEIAYYKNKTFICTENGYHYLMPDEEVIVSSLKRVKCCVNEKLPCGHEHIIEGEYGYGSRIIFLEKGERSYINKKTYICN